jgi:E-phenylitaconyl-CoA hydratase
MSPVELPLAGHTGWPKRVERGGEGHVFFEQDGHIAYFIIDGSNDYNPFSAEMYKEFIGHLERFRDDKDLWVGVVTGTGMTAFSAGGDLKKAADYISDATLENQLHHFWYPKSEEPLTPRISSELFAFELYKPMIAAVEGYCIGAALIILCALTDLRIVSSDARMSFGEVSFSLSGAAGSSRIARQIPLTAAMYLILTGKQIDAAEAHRIGLITEVTEPGSALPTAVALARQLCQISPMALRVEKETALRSYDMGRRELLRFKFAISQLQKLGNDALEGQQAFKEKRQPQPSGW